MANLKNGSDSLSTSSSNFPMMNDRSSWTILLEMAGFSLAPRSGKLATICWSFFRPIKVLLPVAKKLSFIINSFIFQIIINLYISVQFSEGQYSLTKICFRRFINIQSVYQTLTKIIIYIKILVFNDNKNKYS